MDRQMIVGKFSLSKIIAIILAFFLLTWGIPASMGDKGGVAKADEPFDTATPYTIGTTVSVDITSSDEIEIPNTTGSGIIQTRGKVYSVSLKAGENYEFLLRNNPFANTDSIIYLYDSVYTNVAVNDDADTMSHDSIIMYECSTTGTYYIVCQNSTKPETEATFTLSSRKRAADVNISIKVTDITSKPINDAEIKFRDERGRVILRDTDTNGYCEFPIEPGYYSVIIDDSSGDNIFPGEDKLLIDENNKNFNFVMIPNEISYYSKYAKSISFNQFTTIDFNNFPFNPYYDSENYNGQLYKGSFTKGYKYYIELNKTNKTGRTEPLLLIIDNAGNLVKTVSADSKLNGNCYYEFTPNASGTYYFLCAYNYYSPRETMQFRIITTVNINFDSTGGKKVVPKQVKFGTSIGTLSSPTKKGHTFKGWYTAKNGGTKINNGVIVNNSVPSTLYAQWNKISVAKASFKKVSNVKKKKAKITIKKVKNAKGYQITYSTNKKFKKAKSKNTTKLTTTISKLKKGKTYYFKVRAYVVDPTKAKVYGKYSSSKKIKIKK